MGQGGGVVMGGRLLPPGFISTGCGGGVERASDVRKACGCHTTPWVAGEGCMEWRREYHLCPMHHMQARRKVAMSRAALILEGNIVLGHSTMHQLESDAAIAAEGMGWGVPSLLAAELRQTVSDGRRAEMEGN